MRILNTGNTTAGGNGATGRSGGKKARAAVLSAPNSSVKASLASDMAADSSDSPVLPLTQKQLQQNHQQILQHLQQQMQQQEKTKPRVDLGITLRDVENTVNGSYVNTAGGGAADANGGIMKKASMKSAAGGVAMAGVEPSQQQPYQQMKLEQQQQSQSLDLGLPSLRGAGGGGQRLPPAPR